jgi:lipopolysaccharide transport system ATP-binding protein
MSSNAVIVEGLSKRYRIGAVRADYATLRDRLSGIFRRGPRRQIQEIWALSDINLEIPTGEALGLIGHNGAGKSTLLKILSRITEPTRGRAILRGRVASLLEVGTGFHPELTGRENIFLNGAILGMTRVEIRKNFDAIVAFSEVENFLDTPVKHYSSGMYVRLAFAVAAHLTPEILLVDEVLAVGDIEFQRRCLGRMNDVARSGRTVVFVSHNLDSIEKLCTSAVLLSGGEVEQSGPTREVIAQYLSKRQGVSAFDERAIRDREGSGRALITRVEILSPDGEKPLDVVAMGESFRVRIQYEVRAGRLIEPVVGFGLLTPRGERLFMTSTSDTAQPVPYLEGAGSYDCLVQQVNVLPGTYHFELWISDPENHKDGLADHLRMVGAIEIIAGNVFKGNLAGLTYHDRGRFYVPCEWSPTT